MPPDLAPAGDVEPVQRFSIKHLMALVAVVAIGIAPLAQTGRHPDVLGAFGSTMFGLATMTATASSAITLTVDDRRVRRELRRKLWVWMSAAYVFLLLYLMVFF